MRRFGELPAFWLLPGGLVAIGTLLVVIGDGRNGFWITHPMLASMASGVFFLAFAGLVVQRLIQAHELRRWEQLAKLACHTLADGVTRPIVVQLAGLYAGRDVTPKGSWYVGRDTTAMDPISELRELPEGIESIHVFDDAALPPLTSAMGEMIPQLRLQYLLRDRQWTEWSIQHLRDLRIRGREVTAGWAPILVSTEKPRALLNYVAQLNDQLGWLRVDLETATRFSLEGRGREREKAIDDALRHWQLVDARARLLTNFLWTEALQNSGFPPYQWTLPPLLAEVSLAVAFREWDRIGAWQPTVESDVIGSSSS